MRLIYGLMAAISLFCFGCSGHTGNNTQLINGEAALPASFQFEAKGLTRVITSSINRKKATMSTLYGNKQAFEHAANSSYPTGAVLALVTWKQQEDGHWFGANIPGALQSIEVVKVNGSSASYEQYNGQSLTPAASTDTLEVNTRIKYILLERASVTP